MHEKGEEKRRKVRKAEVPGTGLVNLSERLKNTLTEVPYDKVKGQISYSLTEEYEKKKDEEE